jgi:UDP-N-acetylglucosamine diphosphorylase / glucose-1-phosphate thymidylyltransferase / UDP-N-acetylgalactosamine diphosphorylase / glucosamine-1-phosphate N-acetyltransferase / galactosamine-1-phosphate N-acetyltransferase
VSEPGGEDEPESEPEGERPQLFAALPPGLAEVFDLRRPWELLGAPLDELLAALPGELLETSIPPGVHLLGHRIVIGKGVKLSPGVVLEGPLRLGDDCEVRPGAYLRGGVWAGSGCVIGANVEVKHAILLDGAKAPHLNYVGDSILGKDVNLGAGTILSNFRHDGSEIEIPAGRARIATGRRKLGAVLGDGVLTGCNSVLHPGCIVGAGTQIYPGVMLRPGFYSAHSMVKLRQRQDVVDLHRPN